MTILHNYLIRTLSVYHNWHQTKHHNTIHWGVFIVFTLLIFGMILRWAPISFAADITAPTTPTSLIASAVSSSQINLSWTASTDDVGVAGYKIYRCVGSACAPTTQIATSATNSYSNTGLTASTTYTYTISAYDAAGNESGKSTQTSTATQAQTGINITGVSGTLTNGSAITVTGTGFGANGPNIILFDNFESGTNGNIIKSGPGSATIGKWDITGNGGNDPKYSNSHALSGTLAFRGDATKQTSSGPESVSAVGTYITATSDIFVSYWYYFPSTSDWPCFSDYIGNCNNKIVWVTGKDTVTDDMIIPTNIPADKTTNTNFYMSGNATISIPGVGSPPFFPFLSMQKGKWYKFWSYLHGAGNTTDYADIWLASPSNEANLSAQARVNWAAQIWPSGFAGFKRAWVNAYQRWCNDCSESAPTFDDVYIATGVGARARIEIGDAATYATSKNLTIATVTSWSDTSITATIRQGSFTDGQTAYLYAVNANGNVNENGYPVTVGGVPVDTQPPATPINLQPQVVSPSQINLSWTPSTDNAGVIGYKIYRCAGLACAPTTQIATSAVNSYSNTGLTASTAYTYAVSAYDAAGNESAQSTQTSATTQAQTSNCSQSNILCVDVIVGPTQEYSTIQAAVNAAAAGDTILVHAGTYTDSSVINTNIGAAWLPADATKTANIVIKTAGTATLPITIKSAGGAVIVDGQSINVAFNLYGVSRPYYIIDGITFRNATETSVFSKGSNGHNFTVKNSIFEGNSSGPADRGLNLQGADNVVINNTFTYTNSTFGAIDQNYGVNITISQNTINGSRYGIYLHRGSDNSIIEKNAISGNSGCVDCTAILFRESNGIIIRYNLINGNWSNNNITYQNTLLSNYPAYGNNNKILNNTIHCGNQTTGINQDPDGRIFVETTNNIISNCSTGIDGIDPNLLPAGQPGYNIIHGATYKYYWSGNPNKDSWPVGTANIVTDPLFVTPGIDYKLQAGSPAVDAGDPNTPLGTDFSGTIIPQGLRADIGAFEYISTDTQAPTAPTNLTATPISSSQINLSWIASRDDVGVTGYNIYRCTGSTCTPTTQIATSATNFYLDTGLTASTAYTYAVSAYDAAGKESGKSSSVSAATLAQFKQADFNKDGVVNQLDFDILKQDWSKTDKPVSDLNQDGIVDSRDLGIMMGEWTS